MSPLWELTPLIRSKSRSRTLRQDVNSRFNAGFHRDLKFPGYPHLGNGDPKRIATRSFTVFTGLINYCWWLGSEASLLPDAVEMLMFEKGALSDLSASKQAMF